MKEQVFHQITIDRKPLATAGMVYLLAVSGIFVSIFRTDERT